MTHLYVDFLAEAPRSSARTVAVDDVPANTFPGIARALASRRHVVVEGTDLYGALRRCEVAVAGIGPLLVLKLNAFGGSSGRRHPKDAYDVLLAVTRYTEGFEAAAAGFRAEKHADNPGLACALDVLRRDFSEADQDGPTRAAAFFPEGAREPQRIREDVVTAGRLLLGDNP